MLSSPFGIFTTFVSWIFLAILSLTKVPVTFPNEVAFSSTPLPFIFLELGFFSAFVQMTVSCRMNDCCHPDFKVLNESQFTFQNNYLHRCSVIFDFLVFWTFLCIPLPGVFQLVSLFATEITFSFECLEFLIKVFLLPFTFLLLYAHYAPKWYHLLTDPTNKTTSLPYFLLAPPLLVCQYNSHMAVSKPPSVN